MAGLPLPLVDRADPAAGYLATLAGLGPDQRIAALTLAASGDPSIPQQVTESAETRLALVRARIDAADYDGAAALLADLAAEDPSDWRVAWYHGLRGLAPGAADGRRPPFDAVFSELPGEVAPKLALAFAAEAAGDPAAAGHYFRLVWTVDRSCVSAAFGLARACLAAGDRPGAIAALAAVPGDVQPLRGRADRRGPDPGRPAARGRDRRSPAMTCGRRTGGSASWPWMTFAGEQLTVEILRAALDWCGTGQPAGKRPRPGLRAERPGGAVRPGTELPGAGPVDPGRGPQDRTCRHGERNPAPDADMTAYPLDDGLMHDGNPGVTCPTCGGTASAADSFCESCGTELAPPVSSTGPPGYTAAVPGVLARRVGAARCVSAEGYCESCGRKVPSGRDHVELDLGLLAGVTDRGLRHSATRTPWPWPPRRPRTARSRSPWSATACPPRRTRTTRR